MHWIFTSFKIAYNFGDFIRQCYSSPSLRNHLMQMNTSNGWHGGHLEEDLKEALRRLIQKGEIFLFTAWNLIGKLHPGLPV